MTLPIGACRTIATGGVGESGASSFLTHTVSGPTSKVMVLRQVSSSLCPNTGAIGVLLVDGTPLTSGSLTAPGSSLQAEAAVGARVAAVVHTVPLFNGVVCVRLGELSVRLDECELVARTTASDPNSASLLSLTAKARDWYAWNNLMPPKPDDFHIVGEVQVPNPGVDVLLLPKDPQGFNSRLLLLDIVLVQRPGVWPQLVTWRPARFDRVNVTYDSVQLFSGTTLVADVPVDTVQ